MTNKSSMTALLSAFGRAYHNETAQNPIFKDSIAKRLITDTEYNMIANYIISGIEFFAPEKKDTFRNNEEMLNYLVHTQIAPTPLARARFCEDSLKTAIITSTEQYVILGAGMDTFAFRKSNFLKYHKVFEVDHPLTQADKKSRIQQANLTLPENLHFVAIDFTSDSLEEKLLASGFDPSKKTFFSWLGVSYYLSNTQIESMLQEIAHLCADGSSLIFDYADENLFSSEVKRVQNMIAMAAAGGEPMQSCFSYRTIENMLEKYNFLIYELLTPKEIQSNYFSNQNDDFTAFEHINYINAVFKK